MFVCLLAYCLKLTLPQIKEILCFEFDLPKCFPLPHHGLCGDIGVRYMRYVCVGVRYMRCVYVCVGVRC